MNRAFKSIWNAATGTWVAAPETARSKTKGSRRSATLLAAVTLIGSSSAWACNTTQYFCQGSLQSIEIRPDNQHGTGYISATQFAQNKWSFFGGSQLKVNTSGVTHNHSGGVQFSDSTMEVWSYNGVTGGQYEFRNPNTTNVTNLLIKRIYLTPSQSSNAAITGGTFNFYDTSKIVLDGYNAVGGGSFSSQGKQTFEIISSQANEIVKGGTFLIGNHSIVDVNAKSAITGNASFTFQNDAKMEVGNSNGQNNFDQSHAAITGGRFSFHGDSQLNINAENGINFANSQTSAIQTNIRSVINAYKTNSLVGTTITAANDSKINTFEKNAIKNSTIKLQNNALMTLSANLNVGESSLENVHLELRDNATIDLNGESLTPASLGPDPTTTINRYTNLGFITNNNANKASAINLNASGALSTRTSFQDGAGELDVNVVTGNWFFDSAGDYNGYVNPNLNTATFNVYSGATLRTPLWMHTVNALAGSQITQLGSAHQLSLEGTFNPGLREVNLDNFDLYAGSTLVATANSGGNSSRINVADTLTVHGAPNLNVTLTGTGWEQTSQRNFSILTWNNALGLEHFDQVTPLLDTTYAYLTPTLSVNDTDKHLVLTLARASQPNPGDGSGSTPGTGTNPGDGSGSTPGTGTNPGDGSGSTPGTGTNPGDGSGSTPGTGTNPGDGSGSTPGTGTNPGDGSGSTPGTGTNPGDGSGSNPGTGTNPGDGSGNNPIRFADLAESANQRSVANAVEGLDRNHPVYNYVETLPVGAPAAAFNSLSGAGHASMATGLRNLSLPATRLPLSNLRTSLNAGLNPQALTAQVGSTMGSTGLPAFGDKPAWVELVGNWQTLDGDSNNADFKQQSTGFFLGYDNLLGNSDWHLGGSVGYTKTDSETNDNILEGDINSYSATLYAGRALALDTRRQLNVMAGVSYTYHDVDSERWVQGMDQKLTADYNAHTAQLFGEVGYVIGQPDRRYVEPFAGLTYSYLSTDAFTEKGGSAALKSHSDSDNQVLSTLGIRAQTTFDLGTKTGVLRGSLAWQHAFDEQNAERTMAFVDGGQAFNVRGIAAERDTAVVGLGALLNTSENSAVSLDYEGRFASGVRDHSASLKAQWNF